MSSEAERYGQLFIGPLWDECRQLQNCQRSKHWFLFRFVPTLSVDVFGHVKDLEWKQSHNDTMGALFRMQEVKMQS